MSSTPKTKTRLPPPAPKAEPDAGYGKSHGYGPGHGGPSGPGDVPANPARPAVTPPSEDDDEDGDG